MRGDFGKGALFVLTLDDAQKIHTLQFAWLKAIVQEPEIYLRHRWKLFASLLRIGYSTCRIYRFSSFPILQGYSAPEREVHRRLLRFFDLLDAKTLLYRGWFWLLLAVWGLGIGRWPKYHPKPDRKLFNCASLFFLSSIFYTLPYLLVGVCCDFRYLWWTVLSTLIGFVFLIAATHRRRIV